jgi:hypothetical protein
MVVIVNWTWFKEVVNIYQPTIVFPVSLLS